MHETSKIFSLDLTSEKPQIAKHVFKAKVDFRHQRFDDLHIFRQQIEESKAGLHHQPYSQNKKKVLQYKLIFGVLAVLFFLLGLFAMTLPSTITYGLLFTQSSVVKTTILSTCAILSLTSFMIALGMQPEKEAVYQAVRKAKAHLAAIYRRRRIHLGIKPLQAFFGKQRLQLQALRQMYRDGLDKINDKKDEALHLVHRIATAETLEVSDKEQLLNQAIEELSEKLHLLTHTFRHTALPHFT